jgi:predicted Zn-ribbon and HTH transcriptional regulator
VSPIINVEAFKCNKCGWVWISRPYLEDADRRSIPIACSKCKSAYWDRDPTTTIKPKPKKNKKNNNKEENK